MHDDELARGVTILRRDSPQTETRPREQEFAERGFSEAAIWGPRG